MDNVAHRRTIVAVLDVHSTALSPLRWVQQNT